MIIGVVSSGGGSTLLYASRIIRTVDPDVEIRVITDRPCPSEDLANREGFPWRRLEASGAEEFSRLAADVFLTDWKAEWVCLLFSRLVTRELHQSILTINIHPSLLPAFAGLRPEQRSFDSGAKLVGATAHIVDAGIDSGPILAQSASENNATVTRSNFGTRLLAHKVLQFLAAYEYVRAGCEAPAETAGLLTTPITGNILMNPGLRNDQLRHEYVSTISDLGEYQVAT